MTLKQRFILFCFPWLLSGIMLNSLQAGYPEKPNVLFIICDDLNDWVTGIGGTTGHPQSATPHIARFSETATAFPMAYTNNPVCAPSRSSLFYGLYHQTSGNYFWEEWYRRGPVARNNYTLNRFFKENGYRTIGTGKVNHHMWDGYRKKNSPAYSANCSKEWTHYQHMTDYGPFWGTSGSDFKAMPDVPAPFSELATSIGSTGGIDDSFGSLEAAWQSPAREEGEKFFYGGAPWWGAPFRYQSEDDRDPTPDERNATWAAAQIKELEGSEEPFFLAVGFVRPHTPLHAPQKYFDRFPLEPGGVVDQVIATELLENDLQDTHMPKLVPMEDNSRNKGPRYYKALIDSYDADTIQALRIYTQAYLACVAAVDDCIGEVLEALEESPFVENTIVVLTSDHGYNMGEKEWLFKGSPWEESCRVPLLIRAPGETKAGSRVNHIPVSLVDLYPTLVDLCGLPTDNRMNPNGAYLDGTSLRPLIKNPDTENWNGPKIALTLIHNAGATDNTPEAHHYSVRSKDYRYIRYNNGLEELYDHRNDPNEWHNIADKQAAVAASHSNALDKMILDIANNRNRFPSANQ